MLSSIVVVCTGNICRSPMGEVVLRDRLAAAGLDVSVRSSGVSAEEVGNPIDHRAVAVLSEHGYAVPARTARWFDVEDAAADLILVMTRQHRSALLRRGVEEDRVRLWMEFVPGPRRKTSLTPGTATDRTSKRPSNWWRRLLP
ncbi:low molecular weight protein-tyrosine-phosphatase [Microbacterium amylolyticum]|uniref:low molecular weight protein-tyrosine-phosphatase n=1 Tax=Microbacterium amylolyticum TaxID=936337 RepID=UPI003609E04E